MDQFLALLNETGTLGWVGATLATVPYIGGAVSIVTGIITTKGIGPEPWKKFPVLYEKAVVWGEKISKKMRSIKYIGKFWEVIEDYVLGPPAAILYGLFVGANKDDKVKGS
jgi:hypothetical protein